MEIIVLFDDAILMDYERRGSPSFFYIHVRIGEHDYPNPNWMDFGGVILGWWFSGMVESMDRENEIVLSFMDGPYHLRLARNNTDDFECYTRNNELLGIVSISELGSAMCSAASLIVEHLTTLGVDVESVQALQIKIGQLQSILNQ